MGDHDPVESISAVTLLTADMAGAVAFYAAIGFALVVGGVDAPFTTFRAGVGFLNLQAGDRSSSGIWGRVIFWVDDVDAMYDRVVATGAAPTAPPQDAAWGERYFHVRDPDGHELSFARPIGPPAR